jgi:hypothetical protein
MLTGSASLASASGHSGNDWVEAMVALYAARCADEGGLFVAHYDMSESGDIDHVEISCSSVSNPHGWYCAIHGSGDWNCLGTFVRPEEWSDEVMIDNVSEASLGEQPIATVTVELNKPEEGNFEGTRTTTTESTPTPAGGGRKR